MKIIYCCNDMRHALQDGKIKIIEGNQEFNQEFSFLNMADCIINYCPFCKAEISIEMTAKEAKKTINNCTHPDLSIEDWKTDGSSRICKRKDV